MKQKFVLCTLYRFGYDMDVLAKTTMEGKRLIMNEYYKTYFEWNKCKPTSKEAREARKDIEVVPYTLNEVRSY